MEDRRKIRIGIATFFILCGLIVGIVGSYGCVAIRDYKIPLNDYRISEYPVVYANSVEQIYASAAGREITVADIYTTDVIKGLPYTTQSRFLWLAIVIGLAYVALGIWSLINKDFLFQKGGAK